MEIINNRQVNLWRGTNPPPTIYHIWIKDKKLLLNDGNDWVVFIDNFSTIEDLAKLKEALSKLEQATINGKAITSNPILKSSDIAIGKDLTAFKADDSILAALEALDKQYSGGYPISIKEDQNGFIVVSVGTEKFKLAVTGSSLSIGTSQDNTIVINSNALSSVPTEAPLEWTKNGKLIHMQSGVTPGSYGPSSDMPYASTISVPGIQVNDTGHIVGISNKSITIRDYVTQLRPDAQSDVDKPIILANNNEGTEQAAPVRQASGLTYNDKTGELKIKGQATIGGGVIIEGGDLRVTDGFKIYGEIHGNVTGTATPKTHNADNSEYGAASVGLYGHVRLQDTLGTSAPLPSNTSVEVGGKNIAEGTQAVAASPLMVWNALQAAKQHTKEYFSEDFEDKDGKVYLKWQTI